MIFPNLESVTSHHDNTLDLASARFSGCPVISNISNSTEKSVLKRSAISTRLHEFNDSIAHLNSRSMHCSVLGTLSDWSLSDHIVPVQTPQPPHTTALYILSQSLPVCKRSDNNITKDFATNRKKGNNTVNPGYVDKKHYKTSSKGKPNLKRSKNYYIMSAQARDYNAVAEAIRKIIPQPDYDDGSIGPVLVRLAWHCSGTYDAASGTGGSNGATMRFSMEAKDDANNGLENARRFLEPIKQKFPWMTYADLWTFGGAVAIEFMGGPKIPWKPGRVDYVDETNVPPNGRLPDGALGQDHLRNIFYRMGFKDQEIVALCGAHNLGRTHANRSGFDGPWVPSPTRFSNTYFKLLLNEEWHLGTSPGGQKQFYDEDEELMMLPADMSLTKDPIFKEWVEKYAADKDLFYNDFAKAYGKLLELGVRRGADGLAQINYVNKVNHAKGKL